MITAYGGLERAVRRSRTVIVERRSLGQGDTALGHALAHMTRVSCVPNSGRHKNGAVAPPPPLLVTLPAPILAAPRLWIRRATWDVRLKRYRRVRGPVRLSIAFAVDPRGRLDLLARAVVDLLTATNLIDGDGPHVLKELTLRWGAGDTVQIRIEPWSEQ
jgi:hypothetical protein